VGPFGLSKPQSILPETYNLNLNLNYQVHVSGPSGLDVGDRRGCLKACTPDDPDEYPVLVEPEMDIYLVEVSCALFRVCFFEKRVAFAV